MENINNLPPQLTPKGSQSASARPIAAAAHELKKLAEMPEEKPAQMPDLGKKVDIKI